MLKRLWHEMIGVFTSRDFWILLGWSVVALGVFGYLLWVAIKSSGTIFQVTPVLCGGNQVERRIFALVFAGPLFGVSVAVAIGELWNVLSKRRKGMKAGFGAFSLYALLGLLLSAVIMIALQWC